MNDIQTKLQSITNTELELSRTFGPQVLNYANVLQVNAGIKIKFPELTKSSEQLLMKYISQIEQVLGDVGYAFQAVGNTVIEKYLSASEEIYTARYIQAKVIFGEYNPIRIYNKFEKKLFELNPEVMIPDITFAVDKPDLFITDEYGNIDKEKTIQNESINHDIAITLTTVTEVEKLADVLLDDLAQITIKGLAPIYFKDSLLLLNEEIAEHCLLYFNKQVYDYISKGITPAEAKANIISYYHRELPIQATSFPPLLKELEINLRKILEDNLLNNKDLQLDTKKILYQDYIELILFYMKEGKFLAPSSYKINFRDPDPENSMEQQYQLLFDTYLIDDTGHMDRYPTETYAIDLSAASKILIFEAVTNNHINPYFTLENYLDIND